MASVKRSLFVREDILNIFAILLNEIISRSDLYKILISRSDLYKILISRSDLYKILISRSDLCKI